MARPHQGRSYGRYPLPHGRAPARVPSGATGPSPGVTYGRMVGVQCTCAGSGTGTGAHGSPSPAYCRCCGQLLR
jgi:hypothetical protein